MAGVATALIPDLLGSPPARTSYVNDKKHGDWITTNDVDTVLMECTYKMGKLESGDEGCPSE